MGSISLQRIMLADDEPDILEISRIALEAVGGYEVMVCESGGELLEKYPDFKPDLVVIDVLMPDMSGPEALEALRRSPAFDGGPVVFLTGVIEEEKLAAFFDMGVADVILKPFDPMALADRIGSIWETAHGE